MAAVASFKPCQVCGEVDNKIKMKEIRPGEYVHYGCDPE